MEHLFRNKLAPAEVFSVATVRVWEGGGMVGNKGEGGISQGADTSSHWSLWSLNQQALRTRSCVLRIFF